MKALIIDDEADICFLLRRRLLTRQFSVESASSLEDGKKLLGRFSPGLLFLDIRLPDGSGLEQIRAFKSLSAEMKVIVMSAFDGDMERMTAMDNGADGFLAKPIRTELLDKIIDGYIATSNE